MALSNFSGIPSASRFTPASINVQTHTLYQRDREETILKTQVKTASVLAFERKLDPSDALMFAGSWSSSADESKWTPVTVREKSVRGTISNRLKAKEHDPVKLDAKIQSPNLQRVDVATLPPEADSLNVRFSLRILPGLGVPSACNNLDYQALLLQRVKDYLDMQGVDELARRYACNLANGRFLWRNRIGAEEIVIRITHRNESADSRTWEFDALALSLRHFEPNVESKQALAEVTELVASALGGDHHALFHVSAFVRLGAGLEVYPSQELVLDRVRGDKIEAKQRSMSLHVLDRVRGDKSRTLYDVNGVAAIHSQKIGNAIRTIDTWHNQAEEVGPIAVEPYGSVTTLGKAFRQPRDKSDFYTLLDSWVVDGKELSLEEQHFVIAVLIRGGVFGEADTKE